MLWKFPETRTFILLSVCAYCLNLEDSKNRRKSLSTTYRRFRTDTGSGIGPGAKNVHEVCTAQCDEKKSGNCSYTTQWTRQESNGTWTVGVIATCECGVSDGGGGKGGTGIRECHFRYSNQDKNNRVNWLPYDREIAARCLAKSNHYNANWTDEKLSKANADIDGIADRLEQLGVPFGR